MRVSTLDSLYIEQRRRLDLYRDVPACPLASTQSDQSDIDDKRMATGFERVSGGSTEPAFAEDNFRTSGPRSPHWRFAMREWLERWTPWIVAGLAVAMIIVAPIAFANFHRLHTDDAVSALSGESVSSLQRDVTALRNRLQNLEARAKLPGPAGPKGERGQTGLPGGWGAPGAAGRKGEQGAQGDRGDTGIVGPPGATGGAGPTGAAGPKGEKGDRGTGAGDPGPKGDKGDVGPPGPKGDPAPTPSGPINREIERGSKGEMTTYLVSCLGLCRDVHVHLEVEAGDADLYAKEGTPPKIENSNCDDCPLCKSRSSNLEDSCGGIATNRGDSFYLTVTAHKSFTKAKLKISGFNLKSVVDQTQ